MCQRGSPGEKSNAGTLTDQRRRVFANNVDVFDSDTLICTTRSQLKSMSAGLICTISLSISININCSRGRRIEKKPTLRAYRQGSPHSPGQRSRICRSVAHIPISRAVVLTTPPNYACAYVLFLPANGSQRTSDFLNVTTIPFPQRL